MMIFKEQKLLRKQMELLSQNSEDCVPGDLQNNSQVMAGLGKELLKYSLLELAIFMLCGYLAGNFLGLITQLLRMY